MNATPATAGRLRIGLALGATLLVSAACAAGQQAQTAAQHSSVDGANVTVHGMALRDLAIEAPSGNSYDKGTSAALSGVFVNNANSDDTLTGITSAAFTGWSSGPTTPGSGSVAPLGDSSSAAGSTSAAQTTSVPIAAGNRFSSGTPEATNTVLLSGLKQVLYPGSSVRMTFTFAKAGSVSAFVPVETSTNPGNATVEPLPGETAAG